MVRTERDVLNHLIEICRDGARGFRLAADHVANPELKRLFGEAAFQRKVFADELVTLEQTLGAGSEPAGGTAAGALHRGWMMLKDAMTQYDEPSILKEAIRGEKNAANAYAEAVLGMLSPKVRDVIQEQYDAVLAMQRELDKFAVYPAHA